MPVDHHPKQRQPESYARNVTESETPSVGSPLFRGKIEDFSLIGSGPHRKNHHEKHYMSFQEKPGKSVDPRLLVLLEFFKELYFRRRDLFKKLFPRLHDKFSEFSESLTEWLEHERRGRFQDRVVPLRRSLSVGSVRTTSREIGGADESQLKIQRFKVRTVDLDDDAPPSGGVQGGKGGDTTSSGGSKSK